jgi:hypothetical protein
MAGKEGLHPKYTPEQINKLRASRALADAEAIKHGAVYVDDKGIKGRLEFTRAQVGAIKWAHESGTPAALPAETQVGRPPQSSRERMRLIGHIAHR